MKPLLGCGQATRLDALTRASASIPDILLMEDASLRMWDALSSDSEFELLGRERPMLALCGSGGNAGDALAVLRLAHFAGHRDLAVILAKDELGESASVFAASLRALGVPFFSWTQQRDECASVLASAGTIIDGLSGTGLKGPLREGASTLAAAASAVTSPRARTIVASVDLPSGLGDEGALGPAISATCTLALEPQKACLHFPATRALCGRIIAVPGPFPKDFELEPEAWHLEASDLLVLSPKLADGAHKGMRGRVAVFAGSVGTSGAACLASRAVLAAGAGVSALFASKDLLPLVAPALDAVMVKPEPLDASAFDADSWDVLLIGPGWGCSEARAAAIDALLSKGRPTVIDADGLRLLGSRAAATAGTAGPRILTPHPGEFAAMTGMSVEDVLRAPPQPLRKAARDFGAVIILKSQVTWIAAPSGELAAWDGMESGLGTAGSGDVLAGLAAGLLARAAAAARSEGRMLTDAEAFSAARAAVIAHGRAGKTARAAYGWFEAGALIGESAKVLGA